MLDGHRIFRRDRQGRQSEGGASYVMEELECMDVERNGLKAEDW